MVRIWRRLCLAALYIYADRFDAVPKPRPGVFRITKNVHNILQGVSHPDQRISADEKQGIIDWIDENARRYWFSEGGPLRPVEEGGADVVMVCFDLGSVCATLMGRKYG